MSAFSTSKQGHLALTGTVLRLTNYGEAHRIVEILSHEMGKVSLLARGARASKRRFAGTLDVFATLRFQVTRGRGLWTLQAADQANMRLGIRTAWERLERGGLLCACVRRLAPEHEAAPTMLSMLEAGLDLLARGEVAAAAALYPRVAQAAGILPDMQRCGQCGASAPTCLDQAQGLVCARCAPGATPLTPATLAALDGAPVHDAATAAAVEGAVLAWVEWHSGQPFRAH